MNPTSRPSIARSSLPSAAALIVVLAAWPAISCLAPRGGEARAKRVKEKITFADRFIQTQNYTEALRLLDEAIRLDPSNAEAHYYMGVSHFLLSDLPAAESSLKRSLQLRKRNADAHNVLGLVYKQKGLRARSLEEYREALAVPGYAAREKVYLNMAVCLDEMGETEEAIRHLRLAVEEQPHYYPAHWELAKILDRQDRTREAIEQYEIAAPQYASDPSYHYQIGLAYFRERRYQEARTHLAKVVAELPGTEKAIRAKEILELIGAPADRGARDAQAAPNRPR